MCSAIKRAVPAHADIWISWPQACITGIGLAARVFHHDFAGKRKTRFLLHRQGVQFGPQHDRGSRSVSHNGHNAGSPDASGDLVAQGLHAGSKFGRGLHLLERQLRILMKVDIQGFDVGIDGIHFGCGRSGPGGLARSASSEGKQPEEHNCKPKKTHMVSRITTNDTLRCATPRQIRGGFGVSSYMDERSGGMNYKVTVIGAGRMGSALATALFHKGFATTVWNRTGAKTQALSRLGLSVAQSVEESVREADIVVVSLSDYSSTRQLLRQPDVETALGGKIVVQLSSGTPKEAREMDSWARRCGIAYLDGAILGSPGWVGTPSCTIFYSGPEEVFNRAKPVLMAFGDRTVFVGHEIGHASAFDVSVLTFGVSAMLGFLQGQVVWESENLPAGGFLETIQGMMPAMESIFSDMSRRVSSKDYSGDQASLEAYSVVTKQLVSWCQDRGSDHTIPDAYVNLMERAIQAGQSQADFACLFEILSDTPR